MRVRTTVTWLLPAIWLAASPATASDSIRCEGGIVRVGDARIDLLAKCGQPTLQEEEPVAPGRVGDPGLALVIERWTYNFGPQQFIQVVSLQGGKVIAVERGSYGYDLPDRPRDVAADRALIPRARCAHDAFRVGDLTLDVLARCGDPFSRELRQVGQRVVEVWTYDFGPSELVRHLEFEGGRLARIKTGSYGYSK